MRLALYRRQEQQYRGLTLLNMGALYSDLGDRQKSLKYNKRAVVLLHKLYCDLQRGDSLGNPDAAAKQDNLTNMEGNADDDLNINKYLPR